MFGVYSIREESIFNLKKKTKTKVWIYSKCNVTAFCIFILRHNFIQRWNLNNYMTWANHYKIFFLFPKQDCSIFPTQILMLFGSSSEADINMLWNIYCANERDRCKENPWLTHTCFHMISLLFPGVVLCSTQSQSH